MHNTSQALLVDLPARPAAPRLAGRAVERLGLGHAQIPTVSLLASELVTNAVRHAGASRPIRLEATIRDRRLRVCVTHAGTGFTPPAKPRPREDGGYGLYLLEQLACRWGVADTTVWFGLPAAAS